MWKQDDNEFDKLNREAAENYPLDRQPGSWDKLLKRLNAELPEKERKRRWVPFLLLFLFVGGGLIYWGSIEEKPQRVLETSKPNHESKIELPQLKKEITIAERDFENKDIISAVSAVKQKPQNQNLFVYNKPSKSFEDIMDDQVNAAPSAVKENVIIKENRENIEVKKEELKKQDVAKTEESKKEEPLLTSNAIQQKDGKKKNNRWTFGVVYSPDLSSVKFTHTQPLGTNLGLTVDYKLSNRLSLQTGALYTIKNYKLDGKDFNPPKGYWTYYYKMRDVTGSCNMWEIPLNIRFNALNKKSSKVFITTGLSSYLMQKEDYSFRYYTSSGALVTRDRTYTDNENYVFSILNISAGFEKRLNKRLSLQVEPFFKQPLKGVGFGNIKMNSSGVYLGLRFSPGGK